MASTYTLANKLSTCPAAPVPLPSCRVTRVSAQRQQAALLEKILGPDDAVDGLGWRVSYGTPWKRLLSGLGLALVAFGQTLQAKGSEHTVTPGIAAACPRPETQHIALTRHPTICPRRYLFDDRDLPEVPGCAALDERDVRR